MKPSLLLLAVVATIFATTTTAAITTNAIATSLAAEPPSQVWPYYFDTESYSYQEYGSSYQIRVHNMPVSEGSAFLLDLEFFGLDINRKLNEDQVSIQVITQFWPQGATAPERDTVLVSAPLAGDSTKGVVIDFPQRPKPFVPASSHQFVITVHTNGMKKDAGMTIKLQKRIEGSTDGTIYVLDKAPFTIQSYSQPAFGKFKLGMEKSTLKNVSGVSASNKNNRQFSITLQSPSHDIPLGSSSFTISTNGSGLQMVGGTETDTCKLQIAKGESFDLAFSSGTGSITLTPPTTAPTLTKDQEIKITCPTREVVLTKDQLKGQIAWTVAVTTTSADGKATTASNAVLAAPIDGSSNYWIVGVLVLVVLVAVIGVVLFVLWKKHQNRKSFGSARHPQKENSHLIEVE